MHNIGLKLKIGRGAKAPLKFWEKGLFGQIWPLVILPFCDFEDLVILSFSKIFDGTHLLELSGPNQWEYPSLLRRKYVGEGEEGKFAQTGLSIAWLWAYLGIPMK